MNAHRVALMSAHPRVAVAAIILLANRLMEALPTPPPLSHGISHDGTAATTSMKVVVSGTYVSLSSSQ